MQTILVVEDALELAEMIRRELSAAGYDVRLAADGISGLAEIEKCRPDLIILDWMLPGIDGIEVLHRTRDHISAPVLMLTARSEEADRVIGLELGADDYLTKPFSMRELLARVRALLRRAERLAQQLAQDRQGSAEVVRWREITVDPACYTVTLHGEALQLSRTEFDLLHLFVRNPGRVFTREYLLDTIWGQSYIALDRSVDNAILRLRKKLGPFSEWIESVRGLGYRLRAQ